MRPTQTLLGGGADIPLGKHNHYLGGWGAFGGMPQKGIVTYGVAPNRQKPLAGAMHDAIFNTWRRFSSQVLYFAPPMIAGYYLMNWAIERNHYLNSKAGRV
ncbi:ubiquinol-cytochrome c reductase complex-like protein [Thermochaetoides thermophila DSM 1495]|uniref:Cytochrome b-c1 complex subunit 8 n=1 Tax=Chaetomium thermophilum (strain DSM 1495 / CBS 144.50 / IMI 039719) TaxID=759272 RepID=G0SEE2_CHATD|nr:ubiquinol-cytochrome c reductase complex-like protein [Thermochaetoides thermophila DSM 1495]EGS18319.1 ubiquinol-cytochrome c reductase complex-like protein [Thermochaetoides thermophila DSM 1495]